MIKRIKIFLAFFLLFSGAAFAQNVKVAVAINMQPVIKALQKDFKQRTGIEIEPVLGPSGSLAAQIRNGALYDIFLSGDLNFPETLFNDGLCEKRPVVFAQGSLIICSSQDIGFENWERVLLTSRIKNIAIVNPEKSPYGKAASQTLADKGIISDVRQKIVTSDNMSQVNTSIITGNADVGFTTLAFIKDPLNKMLLYWQLVDPKSYSPIEQGMVLLKRAGTNTDAEKFYQYILSAPAKAIFKEYGYR